MGRLTRNIDHRARSVEVLAPFLDRARTGGILVVGQVKAELEAGVGRPMALSSVLTSALTDTAGAS